MKRIIKFIGLVIRDILSVSLICITVYCTGSYVNRLIGYSGENPIGMCLCNCGMGSLVFVILLLALTCVIFLGDLVFQCIRDYLRLRWVGAETIQDKK